ncbi:MAG: hypothetical protein K8H75_03370 [Sulfuricella sp.]|nr:hypothetical protein [Sulfuricella sp.]
MSKQRVISFALAIFGTFLFYAAGSVEARAAEPAPAPAPQTSREGGVTIIVAPQGFSNEARTWDFAVTLETHTQPLDDDLAKSSKLLGDGKPYRPLGWEGAPPGGHHRNGLLRFKAITPPPQAVELQIRRAGEATPRSFRWILKQDQRE